MITRTLTAIGGDGAVQSEPGGLVHGPGPHRRHHHVVSEVAEKIDDKRRMVIASNLDQPGRHHGADRARRTALTAAATHPYLAAATPLSDISYPQESPRSLLPVSRGSLTERQSQIAPDRGSPRT
jgi:hypothetical protein